MHNPYFQNFLQYISGTSFVDETIKDLQAIPKNDALAYIAKKNLCQLGAGGIIKVLKAIPKHVTQVELGWGKENQAIEQLRFDLEKETKKPCELITEFLNDPERQLTSFSSASFLLDELKKIAPTPFHQDKSAKYAYHP